MTARLLLQSLVLSASCLVLPAQTPPGQADAASAEPFNQLSIRGIPFSKSNPVFAPIDKQEKFTRQIIRLQWRSGDPIDLFLVKPIGSTSPPVTLFLYSWPADNDRFFNNTWCNSVTARGVAAVGFVSALTGSRYRNRPWKQWFVSELPESLAESVHDVQLILDYLQSRSDLDIARVGIFGQGSGGAIALLTASVEPRLRAVDVIDPWGDWPDWLAASPIVPDSQREQLTRPALIESLRGLDPLGILPQLDSSRVRYQATPDPTTPKLAQAKLAAAARNLTVVQYSTEAEYREKAMKNGAILDWLTGKLTVPAPSIETR